MNSVAASATRPSIAKRPFQSSASALQIPLDLLSTVWPCSSGTNDAAENTPAVTRNQPSPAPLPAWSRSPPPRAASTESAATKPTMASRPLMRSGAGPLKASASQTEGLAFLVMGLGAAGIGVGVELVLGEEEVDALVVSLVESMPGSVWALTTRVLRRGAATGERAADRLTTAKELKATMVAITQGTKRTEKLVLA